MTGKGREKYGRERRVIGDGQGKVSKGGKTEATHHNSEVEGTPVFRKVLQVSTR